MMKDKEGARRQFYPHGPTRRTRSRRKGKRWKGRGSEEGRKVMDREEEGDKVKRGKVRKLEGKAKERDSGKGRERKVDEEER